MTHQRSSSSPLSTTSPRQKKKVRPLSPSSGRRITQPSNLEQKCNAERPCSTCILAQSTSQCVYDEEGDGYLPGQRVGGPGSAGLNPTPSASDAPRVVTDEPAALRVFKVNQMSQLEGRSRGLALVHRNPLKQRISLDSSPSISIVSSFLPPTIPPEPWISLSFLGEERFQVQFSKTDATDLDMKLCVLR